MTLDTQSLRLLFTEWARVMLANKSVLTVLDSVVGDGDLGLTMSEVSRRLSAQYSIAMRLM